MLVMKTSDMLVFKALIRKLTEAVEYLFIVNQLPTVRHWVSVLMRFSDFS